MNHAGGGQHHQPGTEVSVPYIGSYTNEPRCPDCDIEMDLKFQYPTSGLIRMNVPSRPVRTRFPQCFSTLHRVLYE